jgi:hypothetical protein
MLGMPSAPSIHNAFSRMLAGLVIHDKLESEFKNL